MKDYAQHLDEMEEGLIDDKEVDFDESFDADDDSADEDL